MTNLQPGKPSYEGYSATLSRRLPLSGCPPSFCTKLPSYAPSTASNRPFGGFPPGLQQRRDFTKPASHIEGLYNLPRPPTSKGPMEPPMPLSPGNWSVQDWDRERSEHRQEESQEKDDRMSFEEASQQHGRKYPDLQATVEDAPDAPMSLPGGELPAEGNLHQREHVDIVSPSSMSSVETEIISPKIVERYQRQIELFQSLERTCTTAAQTYWRSQCDSSFFKPLVLRRPRLRRNQRESHPYLTGRIRSLSQHSLASYLSDIARSLWERAEGPAQELEAVYRMGNIYSWGEKVTRAARGELGLASGEEIFKVVIAALDLTSWMLCEDAKAEILRVLARGEWALA